ncbi:MAG: ATP-binding cassette domain-containing protein [Gemmatimonadetes bacterium]|nr:ATP-binding cassette domain-containing protein [Gemmatimonadota bacterium]
MIRFRDVHFSQGTQKILDGVTFDVAEGEVTVVLGPSGTGKSTLLWLILGLWKPDSGVIEIDGQETRGFGEREWKRTRQRLSMVFQENALFDSLSVGENIGYCLYRASTLTPEEIEKQVRQTMQIVELDPDRFIDRRPDELSTGQKRRVAIARAVANCNPEAIFYDEPTTGLDPHTARRIGDLIMKLRDMRGMTSIVVTHEIADALRVGNCFILLDGGKIAYNGDAAGLLACRDAPVRGFLEPFLRDIEELAPRVEAIGGRRPPAESPGVMAGTVR